MCVGRGCAKHHILLLSLQSQMAPRLMRVVVCNSMEEEGWLSLDNFGYAFCCARLEAKVSLYLTDIRQRLKLYYLG